MSTRIDIASSSGLTVGTTPITSGVAGRVLFQNGGDVVGQDANFTYDSTLKRLALKSVGALITDIPFRVRNSSDTADLNSVRGDGRTVFGNSPTTFYVKSDGDFQLGGLYGYTAQLGNIQFNVPLQYFGATNTSMFKTNGTNNVRFNAASGGTTTGFLWNFADTNLYLGDTNVAFNGNRTLSIENGTAPSASYTNAFQQYSADIVAGNAAPHFRTENGSVVKLYQNAAVTTPQGIADALTNLGVLASSTIAPSIPAHDGTTYDTNAIQTLTAAEYAAIGTPNASTLYFIV